MKRMVREIDRVQRSIHIVESFRCPTVGAHLVDRILGLQQRILKCCMTLICYVCLFFQVTQRHSIVAVGSRAL